MTFSTSEKQRLIQRYGSWAAVTGSTSGIGRELAGQLASIGFHLLIGGRDKQRVERCAEELRKAHGVSVESITADLATVEGAEAWIAQMDKYPVGLLINNAGYGTSGEFSQAALSQELDLIRVNIESVVRLTHHMIPQFKARRKGGIIFLSSLVAFQGVPYSANYAASKAYVQSFAEALAVELAKDGIDVLSATPGPVESGFGARANMQMDIGLKPGQVALPILKALGKQRTVVPGFLSKVLVYSLRTAPRPLRVRILERIMGGFTRHQRGLPA